MFVHSLAIVMALLAQPVPVGGSDCAEFADWEADHTADVCSEWIEGEEAYSATMRGSLIPKPAAQQVLIFKTEEGWRMRVAGYSFDYDEGTTRTRRRELAISDAEAQAIKELVSPEAMARLAKLPYYGGDNRICVDGATYGLAVARNGRRTQARQHSCSDPSELDEIAGAFRALALSHDEGFEGMLTGLNRASRLGSK